MHKKIFTLQEATNTLPYIKRIVRDIINLGELARTIAAYSDEGKSDILRIQSIAATIDFHITEIEELGCYYKDWNFTVGLVDFPSVINGKEALLCWRSDEDEIKFFHDCEAGYSGRKPLPEEYLLSKVL